MSSISGVGGASSAWSDMSAQRTALRDKLFSKIDSDGSGQVDASELSSMLRKVSGGTESADAASTQATTLLKKMDTNGDGSLSADELDAGMRALMGPPPSTMQFAQRRAADDGDSGASAIDGVASTSAPSADDLFSKIDGNGDGSVDAGELQAFKEKIDGDSGSDTADASGAEAMLEKLDADGDGKLSESEFDAGGPPEGAGGMHGGHGMEGMPPPPPSESAGAGAGGDSSSSSSSTSTDPLDTNGDGVVSMQERLAGEMSSLMQQLAQASDANGDGQVSAGEASTMQNELTSAFDTALQSLQSTGSTTASSSASTSTANDATSTSDDSTAQAASRLAAMVMHQYARFSDATAQQSSSLNVSLAV